MFNIYYVVAILSVVLVIAGFFVVQKNEIAYQGKKAFFKSKNNWVDILFVFVVTLAICFFLPLLSKDYLGVDSSVFVYMGKMMQKGYVPYKDFFDHKGPLMYFIQWFACVITPDSWFGIWLMQFIHVFIAGFFSYLTARLITKNKIVIYLAVLISYLFCPYSMFLDGGNFTEIYALPWVSSSLYVFLRYFKLKSFSFYEIIIVGIGFIATFLLRVNMIATWTITIVVFVQMCIKKEWKNIGKCIGAFFIGVSIILIPTLIYLLATNSLKDMFDCYILFNFIYTSSDGGFLAFIKSIKNAFERLRPVNLLLILSLFYKKKTIVYWASWCAFVVSLLMCCISGRSYPHYFISLLPNVFVLGVFGIVELYVLLDKVIKKKFLFKINNIMVIAFLIVLIPSSFYVFAYRSKDVFPTPYATQYLLEKTEKNDDVLILNANWDCTALMNYLVCERYTKNKYFYQYPIIDISDDLYEDFLKEIDRVNSDVVVVLGKKEKVLVATNNICKICQKLEQDYINGKYTCEEFEGFYVYRLK